MAKKFILYMGFFVLCFSLGFSISEIYINNTKQLLTIKTQNDKIENLKELLWWERRANSVSAVLPQILTKLQMDELETLNECFIQSNARGK